MKKKILLLILIIVCILLGYSFAKGKEKPPAVKTRQEILKFAIVADSHGDNALLQEALADAKLLNAEFVIGLGDWSDIGTIDELTVAKKVFDESGLSYFVTSGDHDLWDSRNLSEDPLTNFRNVYGVSHHLIEKDGIQIVILDNSDIYNGIDSESWELLEKNFQCPNSNSQCPKLRFVMAHKTPFHPDSAHIMGQDSGEVAKQSQKLLSILESNKVGGFFSGDLHFFAKFQTPNNAVKITTVGAITDEKNFQGPRFAIVKVYEDYSWEVVDVEIR